MVRLGWLVVMVAVVAGACVGGGRSEEPAPESQIEPNPTHQLCRSFVFGDPLDRPMANFVIYHWEALHPWVRTAADDYTIRGTPENGDELARQCRSFLALLEG